MLSDVLVTGLPYVLPFLGVWLVFRLLDRIDLTPDIAFTLGGAVVAALLEQGVPAVAATLAAIVAGAAAGLVTAAIHVVLRIPALLAGIVMWIGMYSVNLRIMGQPTIALTGSSTVYTPLHGLPAGVRDLVTIGVLGVGIAVVVMALAGWLRSELGLALRIAGRNPRMARRYRVDDRYVVALGIVLGNALAATGGALVAQGQGFVEVNMGTGLVVAGAAAILVGELLVRSRPSQVLRALLGVCVGALVYRAALVGALRLGLPATDLRLAIAVTLVVTLVGHRTLLNGGRSGLGRSSAEKETARVGHP